MPKEMDSLESAELNRENVVDDLDDTDLSDDGVTDGGGGGAEKELATKMLQIQSKRFYLDVKQNRRGRFIKVAEVGVAGRKSRLLLAMSTAAEFRDHLTHFSELYAKLGPPHPHNAPEDGKLKSEVIIKDNRRYYLDLKENSRGRFLRVSQTIATIAMRTGPRTQIAIPAQGLIEFRDCLTDLLIEYGTDDGGFRGELPEGRHMRIEDKIFYFDIGQNSRGIYMRVSEVKNNFRAAITLPEKSWPKFRDMFGEFVTKMDAARGLSSGSTETPNVENSEATAQTLGPVGEGILMGAEALALGAVGGLGASGFPSAKTGHGSSSAPNE